MPWEYTPAYLVGLDAREYLDQYTATAVRPVLDRFIDPGADVVNLAAAGRGRLLVDDDENIEVFELFRWYRLGTGL